MRISKRIIYSILVMILLISYCFAKARQMPLETVLKESDVVVTGKVTKVMEYPDISNRGNIKIAEVEIEEVLKGEKNLQRLYFLASPTWTCDISDAKDGERLLLILRNANRRYLEFSPLFYIAQSGGGRIQIEHDLISLNHYLIYPQNIESISERKNHVDYVDYKTMMAYIKQQLSLPK